jgi:hypothetical protein
MIYNKTRHLELLRRFLNFRKQDRDLYRENKDEYMELQDYRCALYHHIFWKSKEQFVLLMDNFIHDFIDMEQFEIAFSQLWWENMKAYDAFKIDLKELKNFELDPKSNKFGSSITSVFRQFEVLEDEDCTKQEVKDYVRDVRRKIQPYL